MLDNCSSTNLITVSLRSKLQLPISSASSTMTADVSQEFLALPMVQGIHPDMNSITCDTLADLIQGEFPNVPKFQIIDCRFPYEYRGGHIDGALNMFTPAKVRQLVHGPRPKGEVLIFHYEFSLSRGPKLCRYLRAADREVNAKNYPHLHYPQLYLLYGGYNAFYSRHPQLCQPEGYTSMRDKRHRDSLRRVRSQLPQSSSTHYRRHSKQK